MNVAKLIEELQKLPGETEVRVSVGCSHETVLATLGEVRIVAVGKDEVRLDGWAANTRFSVDRNDMDDEDEDEEEEEDEEEDV